MRLWPPCGILRYLQAIPASKPEGTKTLRTGVFILDGCEVGRWDSHPPIITNRFSMEICCMADCQRYTVSYAAWNVRLDRVCCEYVISGAESGDLGESTLSSL